MSTTETGKILVVVKDAVMLEILVEAASQSLRAHVSCAVTGNDALEIDCIDPHHVVLAGLDLPDMTGLHFAEQVLKQRNRPVMLVGADPSAQTLLRAMRVGVSDVLSDPVDPEYLLRRLSSLLNRDADERRRCRREYRQRSLIRRVLQDRRNLNQRIELICRDMVGAHRRLFHRVLTAQEQGRPSA